MGHDDRRRSPRLDHQAPVKLKPSEGTTPYMSSGESVNISDEGLYFVTDSPIVAGALIDLSFTMPPGVTGSAPMKVRCTARVIRVDRDSQSEGRNAIAAHIERFETIVAEG